MSGQGRSLQDIYDAGSRRLDELELEQRNKLQDGGSRGVEDLGRIESSVMQKMDSSLSDLESEVRNYLEKAVDSIKIAVDSEMEENRKFLERLQEALKLSCQSLSEDVKQLRESITQKFETSADHCLTLQQREMEKNLGQLKTEGAKSSSYLKEYSQAGHVTFNSKTAGSVLNMLDKNIKLPADFFSDFSRHAVSLDKRINDCLQLLSARQQEIATQINSNGTELQLSLEQTVKELAVEMEETFKKSDSELRRHCEEALSLALQFQEEVSGKLGVELQESYQSSGSGLSEKWAALTGGTEKLLEQVKQLLVDVDNGIRHNSIEAVEGFEKALQERLEGAREHNKMVAQERSQLMVTIAGDLQQIETDFELRLGDLAQKCQARLTAVCVDAETAIIHAHDACAAEFKQLSSQQQKAIEDKTTQLLGEIERQSNQAVQLIKIAAGDAGTQSQAAPVPSVEASNQNSAGSDPFGGFGDLKL